MTIANIAPSIVSAAVAAVSAGSPAAMAAAVTERALTTSELVDLSRALHTLMTVAEGLTFLPGLLDGSSATAAGSRFDKVVSTICDEYLEVMVELRDSQPRTSREAADRGCDLLVHDLNCDQDTTDLALATVRRAFPGRY